MCKSTWESLGLEPRWVWPNVVVNSDETLNRGSLALLLRRQYEFPFGINIVQLKCLMARPNPIFEKSISFSIYVFTRPHPILGIYSTQSNIGEDY